MLHAVTYALADSINALLIGIVVTVGIMLPRGQYRKVVPLIIIGDWLGVFVTAAATMLVLDQVKQHVDRFLASPVLGIVLIVLGLVAAVGSWRSSGEPSPLIGRLLEPLKSASWMTAAIGFVMGAVQSLTSGPFFIGLMYLAAGGYSALIRYGGLVAYASLALSLPTLVALLVAVVRAQPNSVAGRAFAAARENHVVVSKVGGYIVAAVLVALGVFSL